MFGSKNSELTRKYSSTWLEAITFGFSSSSRVWNSQKPIAVNASASAEQHAQADAQPPRRPLSPRRSDEQQRERDVEEHDLLERLGAVVGVGRLQRVEHDEAEQHPLQRAAGALGGRRGRGCRRRGSGHASAPGADHDVERDEQVRGRPAGLRPGRGTAARPSASAAERRVGRRANSQREREHERKADAAAGEREAGRSRTRLHLRRVPDLADQQHRRQHQRAEHRRTRAARRVRPSTAPAASAAATTMPATRRASGNADSVTPTRPGHAAQGVPHRTDRPRRHAAQDVDDVVRDLRHLGVLADRSRPLRQPDADHRPLARTALSVSAAQRLAAAACPRTRRGRARSSVGSWPSAASTRARVSSGRAADSSSTSKPRRLPSEPASSGVLGALVEHGQRHGGRAAAQRARRRAPNGSVGVGCVGREQSASRGDAARRGAACRRRTRPAGRRRARSGAGGAPACAGSSAAGRRAGRRRGRCARGLRERSSASDEVAGQVVARCVGGRGRRAAARSRRRTRPAAGRPRPEHARARRRGRGSRACSGTPSRSSSTWSDAEPGDRGHDDEDPRALLATARGTARARCQRPGAQLEQVDAGDAVRARA